MAQVRPLTALLDVNVVLDVLLHREPFYADSRAIWDACDAGRFSGVLAATTFTNIFYIARKLKGRDVARDVVATCLDSFDVSPVYRECLAGALIMRGPDFEDDVQIQCAVTWFADHIVTRNPADFAASPIPVLTPAEFLARLAQLDT
jgi:hypothetical protein